MKSGFILIDILVGTAIAAVISGMLMTAFYQANRAQAQVDGVTDLYTRVSIMDYQLERDIAGVFAPVFAFVPAGTEGTQSAVAQQAVKDENADRKKEAQDEHAKEKEELLQKTFYGVNKAENLDLLTFISSNPLQVYWGAQAGQAKPRIVRIVYTVEPDKENKNSYILYRQELFDLKFDEKKQTGDQKVLGKHELIRGIKQISVTYEYAVQEKESDENKNQEQEKKSAALEKNSDEKKKKPAIKYELVSEWKDESKESSKETLEKNEEKKPVVPDFVHVNLALWDPGFKRETVFDFVYTIVVKPEKKGSDANNKKVAPVNADTKTAQLKLKRQRRLVQRNGNYKKRARVARA